MTLHRSFFTFALLLAPLLHFAQGNDPKKGADDAGGYIEYLPGNMPLVISVPHGGYLLPDEIPERPCTDCAKHPDIFTIEIGRRIRETIFQQTGRYPYVIINNLNRTRLDPNRNITEAADGNEIASEAWRKFQGDIDSAIASVTKNFGKGLYIDLHGHRHDIKRVEIGYLLSSEELMLDDEILNSDTFIEFSSIRSLIGKNAGSASYAALVRGKNSLGSLLEDAGYATVPAPGTPSPKPGEPYFPGGYNTTRHGSSSGGTVDGIQIEIDEALRSNPERRDDFARAFASILLKYLKIHYFPAGYTDKK